MCIALTCNQCFFFFSIPWPSELLSAQDVKDSDSDSKTGVTSDVIFSSITGYCLVLSCIIIKLALKQSFSKNSLCSNDKMRFCGVSQKRYLASYILFIFNKDLENICSLFVDLRSKEIGNAVGTQFFGSFPQADNSPKQNFPIT